MLIWYFPRTSLDIYIRNRVCRCLRHSEGGSKTESLSFTSSLRVDLSGLRLPRIPTPAY